MPFWLLSGPARLKQEIAARVDIDPAALPYRETLLARLREERAAGRQIILATGTPRKFADAIAAHLGVFDAVHADRRPAQSDLGARSAPRWSRPMATAASTMPATAATTSACFDAAREAIVVAPDRHAARWQSRTRRELFETPKPTLQDRASRCCAPING